MSENLLLLLIKIFCSLKTSCLSSLTTLLALFYISFKTNTVCHKFKIKYSNNNKL